MIDNSNPGEHYRLKLGVHKAVVHAQERMSKLRKNSRTAIEQEFKEWLDDPDNSEDDLVWMDEYKFW